MIENPVLLIDVEGAELKVLKGGKGFDKIISRLLYLILLRFQRNTFHWKRFLQQLARFTKYTDFVAMVILIKNSQLHGTV
jgi:hypothetical protein